MSQNFLDKLPASERDMIVSLPYRVGLFISQSDDAGGDESDAAEAQVLDNLLNGFSKDVFGAETSQYVIRETFQRKGEWPQWAENISKVEQDCAKTIEILGDYVDPKEISAFRNYLLEIGESVAMAFREYNDNVSVITKFRFFLAYQKTKALAEKYKKFVKEYDDFLNISLKERQALTNLARALGTVYI